jgi:hypothetical protein
MAKVDLISGGLSGVLGNLVLVKIGDKYYARAKPKKKTKTEKKHLAKVNKRSYDRMRQTQKFLKLLTRPIAFGYQEHIDGARRPFHACLSHTQSNAYRHDGKGYVLDPALFKVSLGSLLPALGASVERTADGLQFAWEDNSWISSAKPYDEAFLVIYDPEEMRVKWEFAGGYRKDKGFLWPSKDAQGTWKGHVYLAFSQVGTWDKSKTILSDSIYLGWV